MRAHFHALWFSTPPLDTRIAIASYNPCGEAPAYGCSSVTVAASILQKAGLLKYSRSSQNIVNRQALEEAACECYAALVEQASKWAVESR